MSARLTWRLRWRLSVLWMLQWGVTGSILTYLPLYFTEHGIKADNLGLLMAVSAIGLWVAPLVVGQICDRWMAGEKYLAIAHFVGGVTLICIPIATRMYEPETGRHFGAVLTLLGIYAVAYLPTIPLASAITFRHLPDPDSQFGAVRVWGTVGWVLSGLLLSIWLGRADAYDWLIAQRPDWSDTLSRLASNFAWVSEPSSADCFRIGALLSFALSSFCVFLPATPPERRDRVKGAVAPLETLKMFKDRTFALLIGVSFALSLVVTFYAFGAPQLLRQLGYASDWIPAVMTIGQVSEFPALLLLAFCLKRFGLKATFALGMAAWWVRYAFFAMEQPHWLILAGVALHGVCHVFLVIVIQLYIDSACRPDLRTSAQNIFAFITMGVAMPAGFLLAGQLGRLCHIDDPARANFARFFTVPAVLVFVLLAAYWRWFESESDKEAKTHSANSPATIEPASEALAGDG